MGPFTFVIIPKYEGIDPNYVKINKINMFSMELRSLNSMFGMRRIEQQMQCVNNCKITKC